MALPVRNDRTSLEGFEELFETADSVDSISKQIQAILKVLVDDRIALKEENNLVSELKGHINTLEDQIQKLNWKLGQREKELSILHGELYKVKASKEKLEKQNIRDKELIEENKEIRRLAEELSNKIMQEKSKNEQLVELLKILEKPELAKIVKKLGILN